MKLKYLNMKILLGAFVITLVLVESTYAMHRYTGNRKSRTKDDSSSDEENECYPGRNCRPGCYCTDDECRSYVYPNNPTEGRWKCRAYNYPQWKLWKRAPKNGSKNATIIIMAHHHEKSEPRITSLLTKKNFENYEMVRDGVKPTSATEAVLVAFSESTTSKNISLTGSTSTLASVHLSEGIHR